MMRMYEKRNFYSIGESVNVVCTRLTNKCSDNSLRHAENEGDCTYCCCYWCMQILDNENCVCIDNFCHHYPPTTSLSSTVHYTLYDAAQFEHDNNKKDENESVVAQSQKVTFIQNQNQKFHHLRAQESSQFLSSLLLNTILLLLKKSPGLEEPRVKLK